MTTRVLVVDDEPDLEALLLQKFRRQIGDEQFELVFARDGVEALAVLAERPDLDLVVSDISMPRMDGLTLLARLAELEERPPAIIVSAYGDMANIRTAMNRGAFDFLTKPIDFADFEATIAKTVRHVSALREVRRRQLAAERASASLSRYFSPGLAERLAADGAALSLAGAWREITAVFTDITGFTGLVETLEPARLGELLNRYVAGVTDCVFAHEGTVAKIMGDGLHVLFGAPGDQPDHARRAIECALELDHFAEGLRAEWQESGVPLGPTRIGIHTGQAIVGNFGGGRFFDYTAYGDTINIAARLEGANRVLGTRVLASAATVAAASGFVGRPVGDLRLRGRTEPIRVFEPLASSQMNGYDEAFARLESGDPAAPAAFATVFGQHPGDRLASFHLKRLLDGARGTIIDLG